MRIRKENIFLALMAITLLLAAQFIYSILAKDSTTILCSTKEESVKIFIKGDEIVDSQTLRYEFDEESEKKKVKEAGAEEYYNNFKEEFESKYEGTCEKEYKPKKDLLKDFKTEKEDK